MPQVVLYFAGWNLNRDGRQHTGEVSSLPWEHVSGINHAFWAVEPADGASESSFERKKRGAPARTAWRLVPLHPECDEGDTQPSAVCPELPRSHFAQYAALHGRWPEVQILLSIGGWTRCGYFSEMAHTPEGRAGFIKECLALLRRRSWLAGLDIDWEYPACARAADESDPDGDEGCCVFGTPEEDRANFTALLRELRAAMDGAFGKNAKKLTACASGAPDTLSRQDWAGAVPYLDQINLMTYDLAGAWDGVSGHASCAARAARAAGFLIEKGVPAEKLCIGTPLYATAKRLCALPEAGADTVGAAVGPERPTRALLTQARLRELEAEAVSGYTLRQENGRFFIDSRFDRGGRGWHMEYSERDGAAWMYNDDPDSPYARWFLSYENPLSLQKKLDWILEKKLAGLIVWEADEDTEQFEFLAQMDARLREK